MYLSRLILNPWSRQVMSEMANPYEMHRTIMRAFPSAEEGGPGRVLFRVDISRANNVPTVLVQSDMEPDWSFLSSKDYLTQTSLENPAYKRYDLEFRIDQALQFTLRANPTKRLGASSTTPGKRVGLEREDEQLQWLARKSGESGFAIESVRVNPQPRSEARKNGQATTHSVAEYSGILRVTDPKLFLFTLQNGIGSAKGFGFGLLSIAPLRS